MKRWTMFDLRTLRGFARRGDSLEVISRACQHPADECDRVLWLMVGRSFAETLETLNPPAVPEPTPEPEPEPEPEEPPIARAAETQPIPRARQLFTPPAPPPSMREIATRIAAAHRLRLEDLKSDARTKQICTARFQAMYEMRQATRIDGRPRFSTPMIGQFLGGRDHTTVLHGVRRHAERLAAR